MQRKSDLFRNSVSSYNTQIHNNANVCLLYSELLSPSRNVHHFIFPLLLDNCSRLVLCIRMIGQLRRTSRDRTLEDRLLQIVKYSTIFLCDESDGDTSLSCTTRTSNTMSVIWEGRSHNQPLRGTNISKSGEKGLTFDILGHVIVNDEGNVLDVNTTSSYISSHQNIFAAFFETGQSKFSLFLAFASVECGWTELKTRRGKWDCGQENGKKGQILTPIFSRPLESTSAPFFWLTKMIIGGSIPPWRISNSFLLQGIHKHERGS